MGVGVRGECGVRVGIGMVRVGIKLGWGMGWGPKCG